MSKPSETKTENLFRKIYGVNSFIEKSAIPDECGFKSKKGTEMQGYPDFFKEGNDYDIIVEAKATDQKQAIDDIKFYMLNNKINKDLIGIAVSGQTKSKLKFNYYFKHQGKKKLINFTNAECSISLQEIEKNYKNIKYGEFLSVEGLKKVLKSLNDKFHKDNIIRDTDRSLFFSGLMIALRNDNFRKTYKSIAKPKEEGKIHYIEAHNMNDAILTAISTELQNKINSESKEYSWKDKFSFIKNVDFKLPEYKKIISEIEEKIFIPFQNEEKQDILGSAYKIFLSRAGKIDNKNIILTPDHIKELMIKLARVSCDDVVLDTCTGSGGFLMEAMELMINLAKNNKKEIEKIKEKRLIGFENDPVLFALACSNMFLHGDGRTNLIFRSSLLDLDKKEDKKVFDKIKRMKPTKVIINPPYENDNPIKFTIQAIDFLEKNGKLIIIMPTPTLRRKQGDLTDELLKKAKLDFVIKMPNNLFSEQKRTVNTSIFGFTKTPHVKSDDVIFYNLSDDGLISVQHKGRIDKFGKWKKNKEDLLNAVLNSKEIKGISEKRKIYKGNVLNCAGISKKRKSNYPMVKVRELFNLENGTLASEDSMEGAYKFITASEELKSHDNYDHECEAIVFAAKAGGSLGRTHYINDKFIASNLCYILTNKNDKKYPINMEFYNYYFSSIRKKLVADLADGTSKLIISDDDLLDYYIDYIPKTKQDNFIKNNVKKFNLAKTTFNKAKQKLEDALNKINP